MKTNKGFTLVELVISIVIISICVLSIALMYQEALRGSFNAKVITVATALAEEKMEEILRLGYLGVGNVGQTNFSSPFSDYSFKITVHYVQATDLNNPVDPTVTEYKNVEVKVMHSNIATTINSLLTDYTD
jgi:prepilin-type N-terminal cleavage/methylation domain-containing protein